MGINKKYVEKFDKAYAGLHEITSPFEFMPNSPYYHQEEWRWVLPMYVPGVLPNMYKISNFGNVYSFVKSTLKPNGGLLAHNINQRGYHQINLLSTEGKRIGIKITRLVLLHFRFVPGCQYFEVDHIDGNKDNNCLWNLEWVTPRENVHRAIVNNQRPVSCTTGMYVEGSTTLLSDEQACQLYELAIIEDNDIYDLKKLADQFGVNVNFVKGLLRGSIRPYIRNAYVTGQRIPSYTRR